MGCVPVLADYIASLRDTGVIVFAKKDVTKKD